MSNNPVLRYEWVILWFVVFTLGNLVVSEFTTLLVLDAVLAVIFILTIVYKIMSKSEKVPSSRYSYVGLYYSAIVFFYQNVMLIVFFGFIPLLTPNTIGSLNEINFISSLLHGSFLLDIFAVLGLLIYFLFLNTSDLKRKWKSIGIISSITYIASTIIWRSKSQWYLLDEYSIWLGEYYMRLNENLLDFGIFFVSQVSFLLIWYTLYRLTYVTNDRSQGFLNSLVNNLDLPNSVNLLNFILLIRVIGHFIFTSPVVASQFYRTYTIFLAYNIIIVPIVMVLTQLKIFQKYNFTF